MEFRGTATPEVYIIDFHQEDATEQFPLSGTRGSFLLSLLGSFDLLTKVRMANWKSQRPEDILQDIQQTKPKVVITLGKEGADQFISSNKSITDLSGSVFDHKFGDFETKLLILTSPTYILDNIQDTNASIKFSQDLYKARQIVTGEYIEVLKTKTILNAHSFEKFKQIFEDNFINDSLLSYDIETNARPPMMKGSKIIGFSIGNKKTGVYVSQDALDFHMSQEEEDKIWDYLLEHVFKNPDKKVIIHNTMYERPYTYYCKGHEITFEQAHDTLVMARLLKGSKEGAGLKYQAQKNLAYPDWETDLGKYIEGIKYFIDRIGLGPKKFDNLSMLISQGVGIFELQNTEEFRQLAKNDAQEVSEQIAKLESLLQDLYTPSYIITLGRLISEKVQEAIAQGGLLDSTIPYNWIPDKVLCQYGAVDALSTYDLYEFFMDYMDRESTDKVDLHKGYELWLEHMYVAYILERNGMYWNDDIAQQDRVTLAVQATECLRSMLKSPLFEKEILRLSEDKYKPLILADYLPQIAAQQGYSVTYDLTQDKYGVLFNGKKVAKTNINNITIPRHYQKKYLEILKTLVYEEVNNASSFEELKELYNPSSSTSSDVPRHILMTPEVQVGGYINQVHTLSESPELEGIKDTLGAMDQKFLQVADLLCTPKELKKLYGDQWAANRRTIYEGFVSLFNSYRDEVTYPELYEILHQKQPVKVESFDDGGIIQVYDSLVVTGIDQDDRSTWTPQFEWMVNYRLYKKSSKIISSYIDGSVGRESVAVVDREALSRGDHCVQRKHKYYESGFIDGEGKCACKPDEDYLLMAKWSPNTAETGRWKSAMHTVPWGSQVKKYYTSRFKGGTTCCPDYSQMEVRTLAAIARDKNMLELFSSGKDFHTETAKKIYRKDEVTPAERRFSKTATFSLLYGAMEESFAKNYCKGDMNYAKMVYGGFFEAYPEVKEWVEERHEEVLKSHRVSLELSNRFIQIEPKNNSKGEQMSLLRKAQNYPIQAQSADLTGCVIFDLQKYIEDHGMKSLVFMYVHDSIEVDIYPYELLQFISFMKELLNEAPRRRMGLISKADVALGKSLGHEIELKSIEMNDEMTEGTMVLEGFKDEIYETVETWKEAYATVEILEEEYEEKFISMGDLFILKKAYTPTIGTTRYEGTAKVHIKYYND